jgi:hypothetical protein
MNGVGYLVDCAAQRCIAHGLANRINLVKGVGDLQAV